MHKIIYNHPVPCDFQYQCDEMFKHGKAYLAAITFIFEVEILEVLSSNV